MKKSIVLLCLILAVNAVGPVAFAIEAPATKQIVGRIEKVKICPENIVFKAKLDTGADHSSLDVSNVVEFKREGKKWVRFEVVDSDGKIINFEKRLARYANIKRINQASVKRPVIRLGICLGKLFKEAEFNLTDRTGFSYKVLIGVSLMEGVFIVDPSQEYTSEPRCAKACSR